jgi:hypothetical protein
MWLEIIHDRSPDHFSPCNLSLLEEYCAAHAATLPLWEQLSAMSPLDPGFAEVLRSARESVEVGCKLAGALGLLPEGGTLDDDAPDEVA